MKEFLNKWSNWWILNPKRKQLDDAFEKELNELIEREVALHKHCQLAKRTVKLKLMSEFKIVKGKALFDKRPKRYMKKTTEDVVTYHKVKEITKTWQTKYGAYNTIKQKGGSATFYNVGQEVKIDVIEEYNFEIKPTTVALGYKF